MPLLLTVSWLKLVTQLFQLFLMKYIFLLRLLKQCLIVIAVQQHREKSTKKREKRNKVTEKIRVDCTFTCLTDSHVVQ